MQAKGANPPRWQDTSLRHCQCFLVWIGLLFNPTHKQLQGKKRSDNRFNGAYFRGCKLVFACAIKWLAPVEDVARLLVSLDFAVSLLRSLKVIPSSCVDFRQSIHGCKCSVNWCFSDEGFFRGFSRRWRLTTLHTLHILALARL